MNQEIQLNFSGTCGFTKNEMLAAAKRLLPEIRRMQKARASRYSDERASINLPDDSEMLHTVIREASKKKRFKPAAVVVAGIGGSNLGTIAVQEALLGQNHNLLNKAPKIYYADTTDPEKINDIILLMRQELEKKRNVVLIGVSKSGGTTETIANFEVLLKTLKSYKKNFRELVSVITDKNSSFWNLAKDSGFSALEIPKKVGGRYSVFSPVGLFPLALLGADIRELLEGARRMRDKCLSTNLLENPAALSASLIWLHRKKGVRIHDFFVFSTRLESAGKWYRQLMGESIGKEKDRGGRIVSEGITPTVSIGSTDLHSMAQLYLGGPADRFTTFIKVRKFRNKAQIPKWRAYDKLVPHIQGIQLEVVTGAILEGVKKAYMKKGRPFVEVELPEISAFAMGQLLQFKMIEMMYVGFLLNVNPFDQPNVEEYKVETKRILSRMHEV